MFTKIMT